MLALSLRFTTKICRSLHKETPFRLLAVGSLYSMAFFAPFSIALGQIAFAIMFFVAVGFFYQNWLSLRGSHLLWLTVAYGVYVLARGAIAANIEAPMMVPSNEWLAVLEVPDLASAHWEETYRWLRSGPVVILLVAAALAATGNWLRHSLGGLIALSVGTGVMFAQGFDFEMLQKSIQGGLRYREGVNLFIDALKFVTLIIGLFAFAPLLLRRSRNVLSTGFCRAIWLILLAFSACVVIGMETRSVWISGLAGLFVLAACAIWYNRFNWFSDHSYVMKATILMACLIISSLIAIMWEPITARWNSGGADETIVQALTTKPTEWGHELSENSVGVRAAYFDVALNLYIQRPFVGYGPADPRYLREDYLNIPKKLEDRQGHFHNTHLELLLSFGAVGYLLFALMFLFTFSEAKQQILKDKRSRMLAFFVIAFCATLFVFGFATVNFERFKMAHFYGFILGTLWAGSLTRILYSNRIE